jgi:hypothetical protein
VNPISSILKNLNTPSHKIVVYLKISTLNFTTSTPIHQNIIFASFLVTSYVIMTTFESMDPDSFTSTFLRNIFSCVAISSEVLEQTLLLMSDYARHMNTANIEGYRILEMDVFVSTTSNDGGNGVDDLNTSITTLLSLLEKVKLDDITCSMEQCAICLEEFCNESKPEIVRTKCMHVFHEHCVVRWLKQCGITGRLYSCPLCRFKLQ